MGRYSWSNRVTVEDCKILSVIKMTRNGVFRKGPGNLWTSKWIDSGGKETSSIGFYVSSNDIGGLCLDVSYNISKLSSDKPRQLNYRINLEFTPCNFGGIRYWFACPLTEDNIPCNRRVGRLYLPPGGQYFGCRHCYNLTYRSQKEHDKTADFLRKNPAILLSRLEKGDIKAALAVFKFMPKFEVN